MSPRIGISERPNQRGQEILEFALVTMLLVPLLMGSMVTGLNLIRAISANQVCRDLDDMYIHGADFSTYPMQQLAQRLAQGLNLQVGTSFTGNSNSNTGNSGAGIVTVTQIMWVGSTASANCVAAGTGKCTNHDSFVFTERVQFGNGNLGAAGASTLGNPGAGAVVTSAGVVQNPVTSAAAALPPAAQAGMKSLWQVNSGGQTPLVDGQVAYVVETYFNSSNLSLGPFGGGGVYARYFF